MKVKILFFCNPSKNLEVFLLLEIESCEKPKNVFLGLKGFPGFPTTHLRHVRRVFEEWTTLLSLEGLWEYYSNLHLSFVHNNRNWIFCVSKREIRLNWRYSGQEDGLKKRPQNISEKNSENENLKQQRKGNTTSNLF